MSAQAPVKQEGRFVGRQIAFEALAEIGLKNITGMDIGDDPGDIGFIGFR